MLPRFRSARVAGLALLLATPLVVANAAPAFADGESATAELSSPTLGEESKTFTWSYTFEPGENGHGLSNIAIGFCSADILNDVESASAGSVSGEIFLTGDIPAGHDGFGPGIKFHLPEDTGTITVTFKSDHPISTGSFRIQSHSGDGQDSDVLNTAEGPGPCDPTGGEDPGGEDPGGENPGGGNPGGGNNGGDNNTGVGNNGGDNNTGTAPAVTVVPVTVESTVNTAAAPTKTEVFGETFVAPAQLPRTGSHVQTLLTLALSLLAAGTVLRVAFSRRIRSASSPG